MAVSPSEELQGQDAYKISVVSEKEIASPPCVNHLNFQQVPQPIENPMCQDPLWDSKNCTILQIGNVDRYSPCALDVDIKKESLEVSSTDERTSECLTRSDSSLSRASRRKISLQLGERIMQLLMNHSVMLLSSGDKAAALERAPDTPNSSWRRYKRAASFDSRKVVLLFSILSSFWNSGVDIFDTACQTD